MIIDLYKTFGVGYSHSFNTIEEIKNNKGVAIERYYKVIIT